MRFALSILSIASILSTQVLADTVTGMVQSVGFATVPAQRIIFQPLTTPANIGGVFTLSASNQVFANTNGWFSNRLAGPMYYRVSVGAHPRDVMTNYVPGDSGMYDWLGLATNASVLNTASVAFIIRNGGDGNSNRLTIPSFIGMATAQAFAVSNINGSASTAILTNCTLVTNVSTYVFNSASGTNFTLRLPTNTTVLNGAIFDIVLGSEGTNFLNITPTSQNLGTADKIHRSTNFIITPGMSLTLQKQGTNWNIIRGFPHVPIGGYIDWHKNSAGVCATPSSFFVACAGQVLSDAGSPMNGATLPDWTSDNRFARAATTSGGAAGGNHMHAPGTTVEVQAGFGQLVWEGNSPSADQLAVPYYIDVVKLIRVK